MSTDEAVREAEQRLARFETTLRAYDDPLVDRVADAVAAADVAALRGPDVPDLAPGEWLDVLETTAGELYAVAYQPKHAGLSDSAHTWYCRHDGAAFIYGTKRTGELYRGNREENAVSQITTVVDRHDARPSPMSEYPLEERDKGEFWDVPGDQ